MLLNNGVPIDYAMNEACSAGTGSFLEESAAGDLHIERAEDIGPIALEAAAPLKFGEHCSAFINSDIRKAIQGGASRPDIVAGLVFSIVANYLNRVVGNRPVGERIALQGGVAKNPAVPLAFAQLVGKPVSVPPDPELMGCFGVARLALQKHREGLLAKGDFDLEALAGQGDRLPAASSPARPATTAARSATSPSTAGATRSAGAARSSPARRRPGPRARSEAVDHVAWRTEELFTRSVPDAEDLAAAHGPRRRRAARALGALALAALRALLPRAGRARPCSRSASLPEGIARQESSYCFPVEIAHGAIQDLIDQGVDFLFLPHFRDMPSMEEGKVHACTCPLTQGLPYLARQAFGVDDNVLRPVVSFKQRLAGVPPGVRARGGAAGLRARRRGPRLRPRGRRTTARFLEALPAARARGAGRDARAARPPVRRRCSAGPTTPSPATPTWASRASSPRAA